MLDSHAHTGKCQNRRLHPPKRSKNTPIYGGVPLISPEKTPQYKLSRSVAPIIFPFFWVAFSHENPGLPQEGLQLSVFPGSLNCANGRNLGGYVGPKEIAGHLARDENARVMDSAARLAVAEPMAAPVSAQVGSKQSRVPGLLGAGKLTWPIHSEMFVFCGLVAF